MPNGQQALAALLKLTKPSPSGRMVGGGFGDFDGADQMSLNDLRGTRDTELRDRIAADLSTGDTKDYQRSRFLRSDLQADMDEDPATGLDAQADNEAIDDALQQDATIMRPETEDASRALSGRDALKKMLLDKAGYQAQISPEGTKALDSAARRAASVVAARPVAGGGATKLSQAQALRQSRAKNALAMVERLREVHKKMNTGEGPMQLLKGGADKLKGLLNMDNNATEYDRIRNAAGVAMATAVQGGNPSAKEADAFTMLFPALKDTGTVSDNLFDQALSQLKEAAGLPNDDDDTGGDINLDEPQPAPVRPPNVTVRRRAR